MNLAEQARVSRDMLQIQRVAQAVVSVGMGKLRRPRDPESKAQRLIALLAASGDEWLTDDAALVEGVRRLWRKA